MPNLTTLVNTGDSIGVRDISFSITQLQTSFDASAGITYASRTNSIAQIENQLLLGLAKGQSDLSVNSVRGTATSFPGVLDGTFGQHVLVNNVAVDTPNVSLMTYQVDSPFTTYRFDSTIGVENSTTVTAPVYDLSSCVVYQDEVLVLDFSLNTTSDSSGSWSVAFDAVDNNLSRAVNSQLNARFLASPAYPVKVIEPSFNRVTALCAQGNDAFRFRYSYTAGSIPTPVAFDYSNNVIRYPSVNQTLGSKLFDISAQLDQSGSLYTQEAGTYRFLQQEPSGGIVMDVMRNGGSGSGSLPFQILDPSFELSDVDETLSTTQFNQFFPAVNSEDTFRFALDTSANGGGYTFSTDISNIVTLDSTNLSNNYVYMNNLVDLPHSLTITDGYLNLDICSNSYPPTLTDLSNALQKRGEKLVEANYNQPGLITLKVQAIDSRYTDYDTSNNVNFPLGANLDSIVVSYDASDNEYLTDNTIVTSDILNSPLGNIHDNSQDLINIDQTAIYAIKMFDGFRINDSSYCYLDASNLTVPKSTPYLSGQSMIYSSHQFAPEEFQFSVQNPSGQIMFIQMLSSQNLQELNDVSGLYFLNRDQSGNVPSAAFYDTAYPNPVPLRQVSDLSGYYYNSLITTNVEIDSFTLSDLGYTNYRVLLLPKTIEELQEDLTITGATLFYGQPTDHETVDPDESATYMTMMTDNLIKPIGNNIYHGINLFDISNATTFVDVTNSTLNNANATTEYVYRVTFDDYDSIAIFDISSGTVDPLYQSFKIHAFPTTDSYESGLVKFTVQLPFGHYDNVFFTTNEFLLPTEYETFFCTITFNQKSLIGLKAYLQGGGGQGLPASDPQDISLNWTNINTTPILVDTLSQYYSASEDYIFSTIRSTGLIPYTDPITFESSNGNLSIQLIVQDSNTNRLFDRFLYQPGYAIPLVDLPDTNQIDQFVGHFVGLDDLTTNFADTLWYNLFNPAQTAISERSQLDTTLSAFADLSLNVVTDISGTQRLFTITSPQVPDFSMTLDMPFNTPTNMNMWYCPTDIWGVKVYDVSANSWFPSQTVLANSLNTQIKLAQGVVLTNIFDALPGNSPIFRLANQQISIQPVTTQQFTNTENNRYDLTGSVLALSGNINDLGSDIAGDGQYTLYFNLGTRYRGYHSNSPATLDSQAYQITRTPAQYTFYIDESNNVASQDLWSDKTATVVFNYDESDLSFNLQTTFHVSSVDGLGQGLGPYAIGVTGDPVVVTTTLNGVSTVDESKTLKNVHLYLTPTSNYDFVAGRVTAGTGGSTWPEDSTRYAFSKAEQQVKIDFLANQYYQDPSGQSWSGASTQYVNNSELLPSNGGVILSPSVNLKLDSGFYFSTDTVGTFLVSTPPVITFNALNINAAHGKYLDVNNRLGPYDVSGVSTNAWTLPMISNTSLTFNPYSGNRVPGVNNITYTHAAINQSLGSFYNDPALPYTQGIPVAGNLVTARRKINNTFLTSPSYAGYINNRYIQELVDNSFNTLLDVSPYIPRLDTSGGYLVSYSPPFNGIGGLVQYYIGNAFVVGHYDISINTTLATNTTLYGIVPIIEPVSSKYKLQAYKLVNSNNQNLYASYSSNTSTPTIYQQRAVTRWTRDISVNDVTFGATPFNLSRQRAAVTMSDVSGTSWTVDPSFTEQDLDFNLTGLSISGNERVANQFNINGVGSVVNLKYMYMPDILEALAADGSPVFRVTYNGSVASTLISTTSLKLNPTNFDDATTLGDQFTDYEVETFPVTSPFL